MNVIREEMISMIDLAAKLKMDKSTISKRADNLILEGRIKNKFYKIINGMAQRMFTLPEAELIAGYPEKRGRPKKGKK
jgi:predicted transcriptional regulator